MMPSGTVPATSDRPGCSGIPPPFPPFPGRKSESNQLADTLSKQTAYALLRRQSYELRYRGDNRMRTRYRGEGSTSSHTAGDSHMRTRYRGDSRASSHTAGEGKRETRRMLVAVRRLIVRSRQGEVKGFTSHMALQGTGTGWAEGEGAQRAGQSQESPPPS